MLKYKYKFLTENKTFFSDEFRRRRIFYLLEKNPIPPSVVDVLFSDLFRHLKESISCSMTLRLKKLV